MSDPTYYLNYSTTNGVYKKNNQQRMYDALTGNKLIKLSRVWVNMIIIYKATNEEKEATIREEKKKKQQLEKSVWSILVVDKIIKIINTISSNK